MPVLIQRRFAALASLIEGARTIAIAGHVRPDGDAIGSTVGLGESLRAAGKEVTLLNEDGVPENLAFLPESQRVLPPPASPLHVDVAIAVDTANRERLGENVLRSIRAQVWANIDHHISNGSYGDINVIDTVAPATGQIVYEIIRELGLPLTPAARDNLFVAISTDTGSFQYPNTTAQTYRIGAELIDAGADVGDLSQKTYENQPFRCIRLTQAFLATLQIRAGGRLASGSLDQATAQEVGVMPGDTEGLVDLIRSIEGVLVAIYFEELAGGETRVSMRSKTRQIDVCEICAQFGGGGHALAAGARVPGLFAEARARVLAAAEKAIAEIPES
ncbi:bifunctional oligoribonuclease/PAP phosphatase NrnA [soil metagenome]